LFPAAVVGAEAAFTGLNTATDMPGRPQVTTTLVGIGGVVLVRYIVLPRLLRFRVRFSVLNVCQGTKIFWHILIVQGAAILSQAGSVGTAGCAIGCAASAFMLYVYGLRVRDTPYDPNDWPGAKAWPAAMVLISFFALAANTQGLLDGFGALS